MKDIVIFIDDEHDSRVVYEDVLQDMYGDEIIVKAIEPERTVSDMIANLNSYDNLVSIVIDEKLKVSAFADYQGSELVEAFRAIDEKLPVYILTSETALIEPPLGTVEYILDKNEIAKDEYNKQCSMLMRRHINSFNDIKSDRTKRFDYLLKKSIEIGLSQEEQEEYDALDIIRVKKVLSDENPMYKEELDRQDKLLKEIEEKLNSL